MVKASSALVLAPSRAIMASRPRGMRRLRQESAESDTSRDSRESSDNSIQIYDPNEPEAEPEPASSGGDRRRCGAIFMLAAGMVASITAISALPSPSSAPGGISTLANLDLILAPPSPSPPPPTEQQASEDDEQEETAVASDSPSPPLPSPPLFSPPPPSPIDTTIPPPPSPPLPWVIPPSPPSPPHTPPASPPPPPPPPPSPPHFTWYRHTNVSCYVGKGVKESHVVAYLSGAPNSHPMVTTVKQCEIACEQARAWGDPCEAIVARNLHDDDKNDFESGLSFACWLLREVHLPSCEVNSRAYELYTHPLPPRMPSLPPSSPPPVAPPPPR